VMVSRPGSPRHQSIDCARKRSCRSPTYKSERRIRDGEAAGRARLGSMSERSCSKPVSFCSSGLGPISSSRPRCDAAAWFARTAEGLFPAREGARRQNGGTQTKKREMAVQRLGQWPRWRAGHGRCYQARSAPGHVGRGGRRATCQSPDRRRATAVKDRTRSRNPISPFHNLSDRAGRSS